MGKIISDRLLKRGIDPPPIGPTVFSRRVPSEPSGNSQRNMGDRSSPAEAPDSANPDPMQPAIDTYEASLQEMAKNRKR